jgi:hypothetical protein
VNYVYCVAFRGINVTRSINKEEKYTSFITKYKAFVIEAKLPEILFDMAK